jgi:hypothetical protein
MFWVRNPRNCMRSVDQQEALAIPRRILNDKCISQLAQREKVTTYK